MRCLSASLLVLFAFGCGDNLSDTSQASPSGVVGGGGTAGVGAGGSGGSGQTAGAAGSGLTAGAGSGVDVVCADGIPGYRGVRYDEKLGCLDTDSLTVVGCRGKPLAGGYGCRRRISDGAVFWATTVDELVSDPAIWEICPSTATPPPPCFAAQCQKGPRSLCSQEDTKLRFQCGFADSEWDEDCCARPGCVTSADCVDGYSCEMVPTKASWDCWPTHVECDCGGTPGGPGRMVCIPTSPPAP